MKTILKVAVLGVGSLGKEHARIYSEMAAAGQIEFAGLYDTSAPQAARVSEKYRVPILTSIEEALPKAEAFSVVTPTHTHFDLATKILSAGKHALVEKPMTDNAAQAAELVRLAQEKRVVLQVGHVERFNPVLAYLEHEKAIGVTS